ncbi:MAG: helix-turn-helix domain-containing protein [Candidatus Omnitrophica bacterium]|nr:helix-turn-helix domain-containing protein [Candidatus Omnitrophota bacterium]
MKLDISKYFWDLNKEALQETRTIFKNHYHPMFPARLVTLLSRCDKPHDLFSLILKKDFIEAWPRVRSYWARLEKSSEFRNWWQTIYEELVREYQKKEKKPKGSPAFSFVKIGRAIRDARIAKHLSQQEVALKTHLKQPDISKIEEGRKNITLQTLIRLCRVLEIKQLDLSADGER